MNLAHAHLLTDADLADEISESFSSEHHSEYYVRILETTSRLYTASSPLSIEVVNVTQVRVRQYLEHRRDEIELRGHEACIIHLISDTEVFELCI